MVLVVVEVVALLLQYEVACDQPMRMLQIVRQRSVVAIKEKLLQRSGSH